jgi:hypothetical protein
MVSASSPSLLRGPLDANVPLLLSVVMFVANQALADLQVPGMSRSPSSSLPLLAHSSFFWPVFPFSMALYPLQIPSFAFSWHPSAWESHPALCIRYWPECATDSAFTMLSRGSFVI